MPGLFGVLRMTRTAICRARRHDQLSLVIDGAAITVVTFHAGRRRRDLIRGSERVVATGTREQLIHIAGQTGITQTDAIQMQCVKLPSPPIVVGFIRLAFGGGPETG
jgi:hypothetical protein